MVWQAPAAILCNQPLPQNVETYVTPTFILDSTLCSIKWWSPQVLPTGILVHVLTVYIYIPNFMLQDGQFWCHSPCTYLSLWVWFRGIPVSDNKTSFLRLQLVSLQRPYLHLQHTVNRHTFAYTLYQHIQLFLSSKSRHSRTSFPIMIVPENMRHLLQVNYTLPDLPQLDCMFPVHWDAKIASESLQFLTRFKITPQPTKLSFCLLLGKSKLGEHRTITADYREKCKEAFSALLEDQTDFLTWITLPHTCTLFYCLCSQFVIPNDNVYYYRSGLWWNIVFCNCCM